MRNRLVFAVLGLAAVVVVFGQSSAKADHCPSGYGVGYGGYGYGSCYGDIVTPVVPVVPSCGYGYRDYGVRYGGYDHHHHHYAAPYRHRSYRHGYGNNIHVVTPGLHLDLNY